MTRFFSGPFNRCIFKARYFIVVGFVVLGIAAAIIASDISPLTEPEDYLPADHEITLLRL